jgi:hypothetical protein
MQITLLDAIARTRRAGATRRRVVRLLGTSAAVGALATAGLGGKSPAAKKSKNKAKTITICHEGQTRQVRKQGWQAHYPGATRGGCVRFEHPALFCTQWILSGGADPTTPIGVDDDLTITVNGTAVTSDANQMPDNIPPVSFAAHWGDQLTVTAVNATPACRAIGPLWLHCSILGESRQLSVGQNDGCVSNGWKAGPFFSQVYTVEL